MRTTNARQWSLAHGIDEYGVELELPRNLPDEEYRGTVGVHPPYNVVLPVRFTKLSTSQRQLDVVFPVAGFVFGRHSQPWLQVLVRDRYVLHARNFPMPSAFASFSFRTGVIISNIPPLSTFSISEYIVPCGLEACHLCDMLLA